MGIGSDGGTLPLIWSVLALMDILSFKFSWLIIACMALVLNGSNVYGYYKCRQDHYSKLSGSVPPSDPMSSLTQRVTTSITECRPGSALECPFWQYTCEYGTRGFGYD